MEITLRQLVAGLRSVTWLAPLSAQEINTRDRWLADTIERVILSVPPAGTEALKRLVTMFRHHEAQCREHARLLTVFEASQLDMVRARAEVWELAALLVENELTTLMEIKTHDTTIHTPTS